MNGEYYAEENGEYYEDENGEYYEDENGVYYAEDEVYDADGDVRYEKPIAGVRQSKKAPARRREGFFAMLWGGFMDMALMDRMITVTGIAVLLLAVVTGGVYLAGRASEKKGSELATVGSRLEGIDLIGEKGLMAVADAETARKEAAELLKQQEEQQEEQKEYNEAAYENAVDVKLNLTSVMKDLKIKFTNKKTGKLIANVPFSVTITKPDGKSETWEDDDRDGVIYKKGIASGKYQVKVNELAGEKYQNYSIPAEAQSVEVKKDIAYEKVDVSNEVKKESEIDVSKEDTKKNETVVESTLENTVNWVESTAVAETYTEVSKNMIPDPATLAMAKRILRTAAVTPTVTDGNAPNTAFTLSATPANLSLTRGTASAAQVSAAGYTTGKQLKYSATSNNPAVATVSAVDGAGNFTVTGVAAGTATIQITADYAEGASLPATTSMTVTVLDMPVITLDKTTEKVYTEGTVTLNAKVTNALTGAAITAESSNTGVATVAVNGTAVTVTGVAAGEATITVQYTENNQLTKATCVVKVMTHPKNNRTDKLKDLNGTQLFVLENGTYREAVYADYYTADKFFIKGSVKYTGWQTLDGKVYYFTATGEKVTGEQVIQGAKYNFASDGSLVTGSGAMGIDVSKWNGTIDWKAVKNSGISYVIIRCGYRGSSQGSLIEDPKFDANIKGATEAGLKVGVYFFTQATDEIEAVEEASFVLDQVKNYRISYPIFLDVESSGGRGDKIDKATRTAVCKAFCETIQRNGYTAGIYANKTWLNDKLDAASLSAYKIWLAQYAAAPTYTGRYDMWQYTSKGKVSGISGDVDLNQSYLGY